MYFSRYRVLYDLRQLVIQFSRSAPLEDRTPEWFVLQYVEHFAYPEHSREIRLVHLPNDEDIDSDCEDGLLVPGRQLRLRHISRAEVRSLLAMHAKWLVADQQKQKQNKIFDPYVWGRWIPESKKYRAEARAQGYSWGTYYGERDSYEDSDEAATSDDDDDPMDVDTPPTLPPPSKAKKQKQKQQQKTKQQQKAKQKTKTKKATKKSQQTVRCTRCRGFEPPRLIAPPRLRDLPDNFLPR